MISKIAERLHVMANRLFPDALVMAVGLTIAAFALGFIFTPSESEKLFLLYGNGLWDHAGLCMQIVLLLASAMVLGDTPMVQSALSWIGSLPKTRTQSYLLVFFLSGVMHSLNWGLGVISGALLAKEAGKHLPKADLPLLVLCGFSPIVLFASNANGAFYFLQPAYLFIFSAFLFAVVYFIILMAPEKKGLPQGEIKKSAPEEEPIDTPAAYLENTPFLGVIMGMTGLVIVFEKWLGDPFPGNQTLTLALLSLGLLFHRSLQAFASAFKNAAAALFPLILLFPIYSGVAALLHGSGLLELAIHTIGYHAPSNLAPILIQGVSGIAHIFSPLAGGSDGLIAAQAHMITDLGKGWANLFQPLWALPMIGIAGLRLREVMGYSIFLGIWGCLLSTMLILLLY